MSTAEDYDVIKHERDFSSDFDHSSSNYEVFSLESSRTNSGEELLKLSAINNKEKKIEDATTLKLGTIRGVTEVELDQSTNMLYFSAQTSSFEQWEGSEIEDEGEEEPIGKTAGIDRLKDGQTNNDDGDDDDDDVVVDIEHEDNQSDVMAEERVYQVEDSDDKESEKEIEELGLESESDIGERELKDNIITLDDDEHQVSQLRSFIQSSILSRSSSFSSSTSSGVNEAFHIQLPPTLNHLSGNRTSSNSSAASSSTTSPFISRSNSITSPFSPPSFSAPPTPPLPFIPSNSNSPFFAAPAGTTVSASSSSSPLKGNTPRSPRSPGRSPRRSPSRSPSKTRDPSPSPSITPSPSPSLTDLTIPAPSLVLPPKITSPNNSIGKMGDASIPVKRANIFADRTTPHNLPPTQHAIQQRARKESSGYFSIVKSAASFIFRSFLDVESERAMLSLLDTSYHHYYHNNSQNSTDAENNGPDDIITRRLTQPRNVQITVTSDEDFEW